LRWTEKCISGIIAWDDPTTSDIKSSASLLALALPKLSIPFILNPQSTLKQITVNRVDFGMWTTTMVDVHSEDLASVGGGGRRRRRTHVLVLGANMNEDINVTVELDQLGIGIGNSVERVLELGAELEEEEEEEGVGRLVFLPVGSGAWIFSFEG